MSKNGTKISLDCPIKNFLYHYLARHSSVRAWIRIRIRIEIFSWIRIRIFSMRIRNTAHFMVTLVIVAAPHPRAQPRCIHPAVLFTVHPAALPWFYSASLSGPTVYLNGLHLCVDLLHMLHEPHHGVHAKHGLLVNDAILKCKTSEEIFAFLFFQKPYVKLHNRDHLSRIKIKLLLNESRWRGEGRVIEIKIQTPPPPAYWDKVSAGRWPVNILIGRYSPEEWEERQGLLFRQEEKPVARILHCLKHFFGWSKENFPSERCAKLLMLTVLIFPITFIRVIYFFPTFCYVHSPPDNFPDPEEKDQF